MVHIEKKITFKLIGETDGMITLPELRDMGHARAHIMMLFDALQAAGHGQFVHGIKGRSCFSKFLKNSSCPDEFTLVLEEKPRGRRRNTADVQTVSVDLSPINSNLDEIAIGINAGELIVSTDTPDSQDISDNINIDDVSSVDLAAAISDLSDSVSDISIVANADHIDSEALVPSDSESIHTDVQAS